MDDRLSNELLFLRDMGFTHLDFSVAPAVAEERRRPAGWSAGVSPATETLEAALSGATKNAGEGAGAPLSDVRTVEGGPLLELAAEASVCTKCRLAGTRTQVVFGVGNPDADLMFIGEAPGRDEDLQGEPFVGRAGQLLTDIIKAMKLTRADVYIANVIKCRPPENRNPEPDEMDACRPWIRRQVELIKPRVIVTLGKFGLQSLTGRAYSISAVRGQWQDYNGIKLMPTYHPAYLLRTPSAKKDVWQDMKLVMEELGKRPMSS